MPPHDSLVLIIDDTADLRAMYSVVLEHLGYRVETAREGRSGLARVAELRPAVILLDMMMPEMDGLEFLERLPKEVANPPPVIAMSGYRTFAAEALRRGAQVFLLKPIDSKHLSQTVDAVLSGVPVEPRSLAEQTDRAIAHRKHAAVQRDAFMARVTFRDQSVQTALRTTVNWCAGYFGMPIALVDLCRGDKVRVQVSSFDQAFKEGEEVEREQFVCSDVVDAAAPMLIGDLAASPIFAHHPVAAKGYRFYAGVPLFTSGGTAFGTLCLLDRLPRVMHGYDLAVLEVLAEVVAQQIAATADKHVRSPSAFVAPNVLTREMIRVLVNASLQRTAGECGTMEVAHIDVSGGPDLHLVTDAINRASGRTALGIGEYRHGVLAVVIADDGIADSQERMRLALSAAQNAAPESRGIGVVSVDANGTRLVGPRGVEALAEEALLTSVANGGVQRVAVHTEQVSDDGTLQTPSAPDPESKDDLTRHEHAPR